MTDFHSHTLWHLDDGSQTIETTLEMCDIAMETGTDILFLTPHMIYWDEAEEIINRRNDKAEWLKEILDEENCNLQLVKGFEVMCDDDIFNVKYLKPFTLGKTKYILIEFNFYKPTEHDIMSWCTYIMSQGLVPVIAHPERYVFVHDDISILDRLSEKGVLFQINSGSPLGMFGDLECNISLKMLYNGYVDFIGSDAHGVNMRNTAMGDMIMHYPENIPEYLIEKAVEINPEKLLRNEDIKPKRLRLMGIS